MVLRTSQRASSGGHKPLNCSFASKTAERYYYCGAKNNSPPFTIKHCWCVGYHQMLIGKHNFVQVCNYGKIFHVLDASSTNSTLKHLEHWMSKFPSWKWSLSMERCPYRENLSSHWINHNGWRFYIENLPPTKAEITSTSQKVSAGVHTFQSKCLQQLKNPNLYPTTGAQKRPSTYATKILHINV